MIEKGKAGNLSRKPRQMNHVMLDEEEIRKWLLLHQNRK